MLREHSDNIFKIVKYNIQASFRNQEETLFRHKKKDILDVKRTF